MQDKSMTYKFADIVECGKSDNDAKKFSDAGSDFMINSNLMMTQLTLCHLVLTFCENSQFLTAFNEAIADLIHV